MLNGRPRIDRRRPQAERRQHGRAGRRHQGPDGRDPADAAAQRRGRLVRDDSEFIKASLAAIEEHLVLGGILAAIIVFIFLRNFRTTLIAAVAIPTSIIGAFAVIAGARLHAQPDDHARPDPHGRHRHRRRHRRAGEHLPVRRREGDVAVPGGDRRHARDRAGGHGDDAGAARGLHPGRVPRRHRRAVHVVVRADVGRGDRDQPDRLVHLDADAGGALDQAQARRGRQQP